MSDQDILIGLMAIIVAGNAGMVIFLAIKDRIKWRIEERSRRQYSLDAEAKAAKHRALNIERFAKYQAEGQQWVADSAKARQLINEQLGLDKD